MKRFELSTLSLARRCSTTELHPQVEGGAKLPTYKLCPTEGHLVNAQWETCEAAEDDPGHGCQNADGVDVLCRCATGSNPHSKSRSLRALRTSNHQHLCRSLFGSSEWKPFAASSIHVFCGSVEQTRGLVKKSLCNKANNRNKKSCISRKGQGGSTRKPKMEP